MSIQASILSRLQPRAFSEFRVPKPVRTDAGAARTAVANADGDTWERGVSAPSELDPAEQRILAELQQRDREVRTHEQAHVRAGGSLVRGPFYTFEEGPDGRAYAVDGEVSIDTSIEADPARTIRKMKQVQQAAMAPVNPSPQDLRVAAEAARKEALARAELRSAEQSGLQPAPVDALFMAPESAEGGTTARETGLPGTADESLNLRALRDAYRMAPRPANPLKSLYGTLAAA